MRKIIVAALGTLCFFPVAAQAQDAAPAPQNAAGSFGGFRIEGNIGWDKTQSNGNNNEKLGYGGTVGWDGNLTNRIVIGPELSYWRPNGGQNTTSTALPGGGTDFQSGRNMWAGDVRVGYRVTPDLLVFGKGGYVNQHQYTTLVAPSGAITARTSGHPDGYQLGGGLQWAPHDHFSFTPANLYLSAQYVYSRFDNDTKDQHAMLGIGFRFR